MLVSENVVRQEKIETSSTVTSIIPASPVDSEHNSTIMITQNNQPEPILTLVILSKKEPAITPQAAPKKGYRCDSGRSKSVTEGQGGHIKSHSEGLQQCISAQRVPDPCRSVEKLHELLPGCEKASGPSQNLKVTQWMESIDGKEKHDAFNRRMEEKNPPPPKQVPKTAPVARSSNSNVKKQPKAQNKGKGKAPGTKLTARATESQRFSRMPWKMNFR
ncbi:hypothetical protein O181_084629 [Austropuccinia psidii MF-1]|uniref:Uncharacterized protein n=1 Tax=Austropuccinia psidii MF-1 TaxID=1389203 RepID=A0A9Q3IMN9_9BASI|nr:hypothetical protein [Austropuccinia psidii MF-1]